MRAKFELDSSVQLRGFLASNPSERVAGACRAADAADGLDRDGAADDNAGLGGTGWRLVGPAHMRRYCRLDGEPDDSAAGVAAKELSAVRELLSTPAFAAWVWAATGVRPLARRSEARRFRSGLDYTVAHHGSLQGEMRLDATLCFVADLTDEAAAVWQSGETGGFQCYIAAEDEDTVAAEVYEAPCDDDAASNDLLSVAPVSRARLLTLSC